MKSLEKDRLKSETRENICCLRMFEKAKTWYNLESVCKMKCAGEDYDTESKEYLDACTYIYIDHCSGDIGVWLLFKAAVTF